MQQLGAYMDESSITAKVKTALLDHDEIKSRDITVETHEGVVTLSGFVASQQQAAEAVALTEKIAGVKSVTDKLHVNDSAQTSIQDYVDDAAITSQIKGKLLREEMTGMRRVRVETSNGIVLLSGRVPSPSMSAKAAALAKTVDGVKSVKNDLTIEP
ncbi:MAG: Osmotically-inducible protein Y [Candidatus Erwinia impunctatus]|nr:Osmotically-inducible protein Y [Culicoides impunctatus]